MAFRDLTSQKGETASGISGNSNSSTPCNKTAKAPSLSGVLWAIIRSSTSVMASFHLEEFFKNLIVFSPLFQLFTSERTAFSGILVGDLGGTRVLENALKICSLQFRF